MPRFSKTSLARLGTCDARLRAVCHAAIAEVDFVVVCGHRDQAEQERVYVEGKSRVRWPDSRHNSLPSLAVDLAPCDARGRIDWQDIAAFKALAVVVAARARDLGVSIEWGGDWARFRDYPHFQVTGPALDEWPRASVTVNTTHGR